MRLDWASILVVADAIARSYPVPPTLRQVFYRLVARAVIPNTHAAYKTLSARSSEARRAGWFSQLTDGTRSIQAPLTFVDKSHALSWLADRYQLDRTKGQHRQLWVVVEKATLSTLAADATDDYGVPVVPLRGYGSQTIIDEMSEWMAYDSRPALILYVGDFDPTGEDIPRDLLDRLTFDDWDFDRLAVNQGQIQSLGLPPMPGKATDSRAGGFIARHGALIQVEAEAIDPNDLTALIESAVRAETDLTALTEVREREEADRRAVLRLSEHEGVWQNEEE